MIAALIAGCDRKAANDVSPPPDAPNPATKAPLITASPNPVPAGDGFGTTTITWNSGGPWAQVFISQDGKPDTTMFGQGARATGDAPWIQTGHTYEFRLFAGKDHKQLLDKTVVTRAK